MSAAPERTRFTSEQMLVTLRLPCESVTFLSMAMIFIWYLRFFMCESSLAKVHGAIS
ncbi:MAG: hypothetical protein ACI8Z5_001098 [Lentimonas sp.]|jgi:hypothetical protein